MKNSTQKRNAADFYLRASFEQAKHEAAKILYGIAASCAEENNERGMNICMDASFYLAHGRLPNVVRELS